MKLCMRLTLVLVACGLIPLFVVGVFSYQTATSGLKLIESSAFAVFIKNVEDQFVVIREFKKQQIEDYFVTICK